jgi:hypothetical protein
MFSNLFSLLSSVAALGQIAWNPLQPGPHKLKQTECKQKIMYSLSLSLTQSHVNKTTSESTQTMKATLHSCFHPPTSVFGFKFQILSHFFAFIFHTLFRLSISLYLSKFSSSSIYKNTKTLRFKIEWDSKMRSGKNWKTKKWNFNRRRKKAV